MTGVESTLQTVGTAAAALTTVISVLPRLANSLRSRSRASAQPGDVRLETLDAPLPWSARLEGTLADRSVDAGQRRRRINLALVLAFALVSLVLTVGYVGAAVHYEFPLWSAFLGSAAGLVVTGFLAYYTVVLLDPHGRATVAGAFHGTAVVTGDIDDVRRHCQVVLLTMGARLVSVERDRLVAATGVLIGPFWLGNRLAVTLTERPDVIEIGVTSIKLDYVTTSRSKRDIAQFLSAWVFAEREE